MSPDQKGHWRGGSCPPACLPFGSLPWIKKTNQSPTHTFSLSRTRTNRCVLADRLTGQTCFLGMKLEETLQVPLYSCQALVHLPVFFRMKSEPFGVTYKAPSGPLSVHVISFTSFFSPNLPLTSQSLDSLLGLCKCQSPTSCWGFNSDIPSLRNLWTRQAWGRASFRCSHGSWCLLQGHTSSE